jgi:hypothetical protein
MGGEACSAIRPGPGESASGARRASAAAAPPRRPLCNAQGEQRNHLMGRSNAMKQSSARRRTHETEDGNVRCNHEAAKVPAADRRHAWRRILLCPHHTT